jgi:hypothetical protein
VATFYVVLIFGIAVCAVLVTVTEKTRERTVMRERRDARRQELRARRSDFLKEFDFDIGTSPHAVDFGNGARLLDAALRQVALLLLARTHEIERFTSASATRGLTLAELHACSTFRREARVLRSRFRSMFAVARARGAAVRWRVYYTHTEWIAVVARERDLPDMYAENVRYDASVLAYLHADPNAMWERLGDWLATLRRAEDLAGWQ